MISGATCGAGGAALGRHLASADGNDEVVELEGRGLIATGIHAQVAELTRLCAHARTRTPLYHVHVDPPADRPWTEAERDQYWASFETEFGLTGRPFAAVVHRKHGREHEHRAYLRVRADGTAIRLDHDYSRREKLSRRFELSRHETIVAGAHNRAVIAALEREGLDHEAAALRHAGLHELVRPRAALNPDERHQQQRTGVDLTALRAEASEAWHLSDDGPSFQAALAEHGLRLAQGDRTTQLIDSTGATHDLRRTLVAAAKASGADPIRAADVRCRLDGLVLPTVEQVRRDAHAATLAMPAGENEDATKTDGSVQQRAEETRHAGEPAGTTSNEGQPGAARPTLGPGADPRGPERDVGTVAAEGDRPQGDVGDDVRAAESRDDGRRSPGAADAAGAAAGGRADPIGSDRGLARGDRREPDPGRGAAGLARVRDRRTSRHLAEAVGDRTQRFAALIEALRPPTDIVDQAISALDADEARIAATLADEPYADPASRNPATIARAMIDRFQRQQTEIEDAAARAMAGAIAARAALSLWDRLLPWSTTRKRMAEAARIDADRA